MNRWRIVNDRRIDTRLPGAPLLAGFVVGLMLFPSAVMAQQGGGEPRPTNKQLEDAYAACGGPPIQNNLWVQPTPERNRCLEEHLGLNRRGQPEPPQRPAGPPPLPRAEGGAAPETAPNR